MGRRQINYERMPGRFPAGTLAEIDRWLEEGEKRADFLRAAVKGELRRRIQAGVKKLRRRRRS
jgi:hypothetical protein